MEQVMKIILAESIRNLYRTGKFEHGTDGRGNIREGIDLRTMLRTNYMH